MAFHILVVDDQRDVSKAIRAGIQSLGSDYVVATAMSGEEAMLEARLKKFDVLISEVRLTGMSGVELIQKLRAIKPDIRTILTVASLDKYIRREASDVGVDALIEKPIAIEDLLTQLQSILETREAVASPAQVQEHTDPEEASISDRLSEIRKELEASLVLLISDTGEILIQAGDIKQINLEAEIPSLLAIFSAGHRISRLLGTSMADNLYLFRGTKSDLIMSNVGDSHALLIATGEDKAAQDQSEKINRVIRKGTHDLQAILADMGVELASSEESTSPEIITALPEDKVEVEEEIGELDPALDALFSEVSDKVKETDLDSFWEVGSIEDTGIFASADALSYEQARQLGLAPEED